MNLREIEFQNSEKDKFLFQKGNKAAVGNKGGGRPKDSNKKEYLNILHEELTHEKWREIIRAAISDALMADTENSDGLPISNAYSRDKGREFLAKRVLPAQIEFDLDNGIIPVQIVAVEGFQGWGEKKEEIEP